MAHADEEFKAVTVPQQIFMTLEDPAFVLPIFPKLPKLISNFIMSLIVLGCITYVMESVCIYIFTVEYVLRLFTVHTVPEKVWNIKEEALEEPDDDDEVHVKRDKTCMGLTRGYATTFLNPHRPRRDPAVLPRGGDR